MTSESFIQYFWGMFQKAGVLIRLQVILKHNLWFTSWRAPNSGNCTYSVKRNVRKHWVMSRRTAVEIIFEVKVPWVLTADDGDKHGEAVKFSRGGPVSGCHRADSSSVLSTGLGCQTNECPVLVYFSWSPTRLCPWSYVVTDTVHYARKEDTYSIVVQRFGQSHGTFCDGHW